MAAVELGAYPASEEAVAAAHRLETSAPIRAAVEANPAGQGSTYIPHSPQLPEDSATRHASNLSDRAGCREAPEPEWPRRSTGSCL